jgi:ATP-dependent RNA helicase RhlE
LSFADLDLSPSLADAVTRLGYDRPTPIQISAIPVIRQGSDVLARAHTGTGKTAAFGLPLIDRLRIRDVRSLLPRRPRALVLVPTRELAAQVDVALARYGKPFSLRVAVVYGGVSMAAQIRALHHGADVVVATPGRLLDHLQQRTVDLSSVEVLVLDEADRMLDMGFLPSLRRIAAAVPRTRQTLLFSATLPAEITRLAQEFTRTPVRIDVSTTHVAVSTVTHRLHEAPDGRKGELLAHVLREASADQALVFCKTKRGSNRVGELLEQRGVRTAVIHGNKSQPARTRALGDFKARRTRVLVATDIAARGLDIAKLPLVINYDLPLVAEDYVHRIGRTGRAGSPGRAVSLVSASDRHLIAGIERLLPAPIERVRVAGFEAGAERPASTHVSRHHRRS